MDYTRCTQCRGAKKIKGLGGMEKNCPSCKGIGYSQNGEPLKAKEEVKKRMGRPPKVKSNRTVL
jgi:hypothetical protein